MKIDDLNSVLDRLLEESVEQVSEDIVDGISPEAEKAEEKESAENKQDVADAQIDSDVAEAMDKLNNASDNSIVGEEASDKDAEDSAETISAETDEIPEENGENMKESFNQIKELLASINEELENKGEVKPEADTEDVYPSDEHDETEDLDVKEITNESSDYEIMQWLDENGYEPTEENVAALRESLDTTYYGLLKKLSDKNVARKKTVEDVYRKKANAASNEYNTQKGDNAFETGKGQYKAGKRVGKLENKANKASVNREKAEARNSKLDSKLKAAEAKEHDAKLNKDVRLAARDAGRKAKEEAKPAVTNESTDYELMQWLDKNGYEVSEENLGILREELEKGQPESTEKREPKVDNADLKNDDVYCDYSHDETEDIDTDEITNESTDYELMQWLDKNGYEVSEENLGILREELEKGQPESTEKREPEEENPDFDTDDVYGEDDDSSDELEDDLGYDNEDIYDDEERMAGYDLDVAELVEDAELDPDDEWSYFLAESFIDDFDYLESIDGDNDKLLEWLDSNGIYPCDENLTLLQELRYPRKRKMRSLKPAKQALVAGYNTSSVKDTTDYYKDVATGKNEVEAIKLAGKRDNKLYKDQTGSDLKDQQVKNKYPRKSRVIQRKTKY